MRQERLLLFALMALVVAVLGYFAYSALPRGSHAAAHAKAVESDPWDTMNRFYRAVGDSRWNDAYALLSPAYRATTSRDGLRDAYLRFSSLDADLTYDDGNVVVATVKAVDRDDSTRTRTFRVRWTLVRSGPGWLIDGKQSETIADSATPRPAHQSVAGFASAVPGCFVPTAKQIFTIDWGTLDPDSALAVFDQRARSLSIPDREDVGRAVIRSEGNGQKAAVFSRLMAALAKACRLREVLAKTPGPTPMEETDGRNASDAEIAYWVGVTAARYAVEARGVADPADIAAAYGPYDLRIRLDSIPEKYHPETP